MVNDTVISVQKVSKAYRIWGSPSSRLTAPLMARAAAFVPDAGRRWLEQRAARGYRDFWALKDVSFDVRKGESVGIIGRNGSGKSTLLQIIAGTMQSTEGSVRVKGRVAALLELGSGFNPDFTGKDNVYLYGAVLGLTRSEVNERFDVIAEFAQIGAFMDQEVKTYSSGMLMRLAFAVQAAIEPEVLIVDEALSVGDEAFQRKCFARIEALKKNGTTLLFVSHGAAQVIELCDRAILLDDGHVQADGSPNDVVRIYHQQLYGGAAPPSTTSPSATKRRSTTETGDIWTLTAENIPSAIDDSYHTKISLAAAIHAYPEAGARLSSPRITNARGQAVNNLRRGHYYFYEYSVEISERLVGVRFGAVIKTISGMELAGMTSHRASERISIVEAGSKFEVRFKFRCQMLPGVYFLNAGALALDERLVEYFAHRLVDAEMFRVIPESDLPTNAMIDLLERVEIRCLETSLENA